MSKAVYQLEPLTCPSCIKKIESTLSKTAGVESAKVMFNSSKVKTESMNQRCAGYCNSRYWFSHG
ncbi:heavy-metal-associated domain-containing protein [Carnobacterium funditum]|uniref:heavy-metal-associated domain-containing protein n=1 Tax=Carnobacterium funditum TaxID=2752 RepID=UPI00068DEF50|nr:cation transporter [Carnobacterium funditum]